jgi:hypothetical protein
VQWCQADNIGTARDIRRACGLQHMKVKQVEKMCERLAAARHIRGRNLPANYNLIGQYASIKQLAMKRDAFD